MTYTPPSVIVNGQIQLAGSTASVKPATCALLVDLMSLPTGTINMVVNSTNVGNSVTLPASAIASTVTVSQGTTQLTQGTNYYINNNVITWSQSPAVTGAVSISYQYADNTYFSPLAYSTSNSVEGYYGTAFGSDGSINSMVSAGAICMFNGGVTTIIIQPYIDSSVTLPSDMSSSVSVPNLQTALTNLLDRDDVDTIVPVGLGITDLQTIGSAIVAPTAGQTQKRGIFAVDSGSSTVTDMSTYAQSFNSAQIMLVGNISATSTAGATLPPSMYACTIAGLSETVAFNQTLTHMIVPGFALDHSLTDVQMNAVAPYGVTFVSAINGNNRIRQSLCTIQGTLVDWDYGAVFNYMTNQLQTLFEPYIGKPQTTTVLNGAYGVIEGFLQRLTSNNIIAGYKDISVTYSSTQQGTMLVSFSAGWLSPLNYIRVNFNFNTSSGSASNYIQNNGGSGYNYQTPETSIALPNTQKKTDMPKGSDHRTLTTTGE